MRIEEGRREAFGLGFLMFQALRFVWLRFKNVLFLCLFLS